jgi:uncharacterized protein YndB with AHSA1/START domain
VPAPFRFDRHFAFEVAADELWATMVQTERYPAWWSWLREFDGALEEGSAARCVIRAPLPYSLRFTIEVTRVVPEEWVVTRVHGDLEGPASLELSPDGAGRSIARLQWELELRDRALRTVAKLGRPAMVWAHDRVVEVGLREFERRALDGKRG